MGFPIVNMKIVKNWSPKDLDEKVGKFSFQEPGDSDLNEGNFMAQLVFIDASLTVYVIDEWDVRSEEYMNKKEQK